MCPNIADCRSAGDGIHRRAENALPRMARPSTSATSNPGRCQRSRSSTPVTSASTDGPAPEITAADVPPLAGRPTSRGGRRHGRRPVLLMQPVDRSPAAAGSGRSVSACTSSAGGGRVRRGVGVRHGGRQQSAGVVRRAGLVGTEHAPRGLLGCTSRRTTTGRPFVPGTARVKPPNSAGATLSGWPSISVARTSTSSSDSRRSPPARAVRAPSEQPGDDRGRRRAQPAAVRDARSRTRRCTSGQRHAGAIGQSPHRPHDEMIGGAAAPRPAPTRRHRGRRCAAHARCGRTETSS